MIVKRYLSKEVFSSLLTITFVLLLILLSQQVVRYLNYVAIGKIPTNVLLTLVSFEIPYLLALLLPLGLYLGILLGLGRLHANNEMTIFTISGFGQKRLLILTFTISLLVSLFILFLMNYVNPIISAKRQILMTTEAAAIHLVQTMVPGRFEVSPDGRHVMYVEKVVGDEKRAENVFLAQSKVDTKDKNKQDKNKLIWSIVFAKEGGKEVYPKTKEAFFVTKNGFRYEGTPGENDFKIIEFAKYGIRLPETGVQVDRAEVEAMPTSLLFRAYVLPKCSAELQWRISIAILALILGMLAVPFSERKPKQNRFLIIIPAILIYVIYIDLLFIARRWVEIGKVSTIVGMWWVHAIFLGILFITYLFNGRRWKKL